MIASYVFGARWAMIGAGILAVTAPACLAQNSGRGWQDSAQRLEEERTLAETCVSVLKRHSGDDIAVLSRGQLAYADAKADADAAIAGLTMALAQGSDVPVSLPVIEERLTDASVKREIFCGFAVEQIPNVEGQSKDVMGNVLLKTVEPLIEAAKDLYLNYRQERAIKLETISNEISAKKWRKFEDIP